MKRIAKYLAILVLALLCGSASWAQTIRMLVPSSTTAGSPDLTLTVYGGGFSGGNTVLWNGAPLTTVFVSANQLTATVPAAKLAAIGAAEVTVQASGTSNGLNFQILSPLANVTSWSPKVFTPGVAILLTVYGSGFSPTAVVYFDGIAVSTTFVSDRQVIGSVPSIDVQPGRHTVHVLNGTPVTPTKVLSLSTQTLNLGSQTVGTTTSPSTITITNTSSATVTFSSFSLGGVDPSEYAISANTCGGTLAPSANCAASLTATPANLGSRPAIFSVASDATGSPISANLAVIGTATTTGSVAFNTTNLVHGTVVQSTPSSPLTSVLTNTGLPTYTISSITKTGANTADFDITSSTCTTASYTTGQQCSFTSVFTPSTTGAESAAISIADNSATTPNVISLSGSGIASGGHYMTLTWTAPGSLSVTGYNVYRATVSGGPYTLLTGTPVTTTSYTDNTVVHLNTYYYVVTSIGANPPYSTTESVVSTEASGTIP